MDVTRALRTGSLILGATTLVACGGGGGSSDGGDSAVALTCESEAPPTYVLTLDANGYAEQSVPITNSDDVINMLGLYQDAEVGFALVDSVRTALTNQSSDQPVCANEGGTATLTVSGSGSNTDERWEFSNCVVNTNTARFEQVRLSGVYRNSEEITVQTNQMQRGEGLEIYDNIEGEIVISGKAFTIRGRSSLVFEVDLSTEDVCLKENVSGLEFELAGNYVALLDSETRLKQSGSRTDISIEGTLIGSAIGGYLGVSTPAPILFVDSEPCPREGIISVSSNGEARVLYGDSANGTATGVAVWINGRTVQSSDNCQAVGVAPLY